MAIEQYKVEITPLEKDNTYASEAIDVTEYTRLDGVTDIIEQVDDGDFDLGVFTLDSVKLRMINFSGKFSDVNSASSIFPFRRDLAKVVITFLDDDGNPDAQFRGFIDDTLTREDFDNAEVALTVISKSGLFNKIAVLGGSVSNNMTIKEALTEILDRPQVTNYLNYDIANMNPALNIEVNAGAEFDNITYRDALNTLMRISGSVLLVDSSDNIIVRDRTRNNNTPHKFYNEGDPLGRVNINRLAQFNTGVQRAFNFYKIDNIFAKDDNLIAENGLRQKDLSLNNIITNVDTRQVIVNYYLDNFAVPKTELQIQMETDIAKDVEILDTCTLDYLPIVKMEKNKVMPLVDVVEVPFDLPQVLNKRYISSNIGFKVIAKQVNIGSHTTTLKLREIGTKAGDSTL